MVPHKGQKKNYRWRSSLAVTAGLLALCGSTPVAYSQEAGPLRTIPARGLFDLGNGTVEAWVKFDFEPTAPVTGYTGRGQFFLFRVPKSENDLGAEMSIFFASNPSGQAGEKGRSFTFLRAGFAIDGKEIPHPLVVECAGWKRDEWHHIAVAWKEGRYMAVYFDGKEVVNKGETAEVNFPVSTERDIPATGELLLGSIFERQANGLIVDDFRLSSAARGPNALGFGQTPLQPDPFTMLLENYENVEPGKTAGSYITTPAVVATTGLPKTYVIPEGRLVPGKSGQALAFQPEPSPQ